MGSNARRFRSNIREAIAIVVLIVLAIVGFRYLGREVDDSESATVTFENTDGSRSPVFQVKVARDPGAREKGLMYVKHLDEREGMVFVYPKDQELKFWMKNTYVPLDMVFIDSAMKVVGVLRDVPVLTLDERTVGKPSRFVVELAGGSAARAKIDAGSIARFSDNVR